jgi:hypothetical protein
MACCLPSLAFAERPGQLVEALTSIHENRNRTPTSHRRSFTHLTDASFLIPGCRAIMTAPAEKIPAVDTRLSDSEDALSHGTFSQTTPSATTEKLPVPWWSYIWDYDPGRPKEETKFLARLDTSVLIILSLGYFIKNLDQTNIVNACMFSFCLRFAID